MQPLKKNQGGVPQRQGGLKVRKGSRKTQGEVEPEPAGKVKGRKEQEKAPPGPAPGIRARAEQEQVLERPEPEVQSGIEPEKVQQPSEPPVYGRVVKRVTVRIDQGTVIKGKINLRSEFAIRDGSFDSYSLDSGAFFTRVRDLFAKGLNPFIEVFEVEDCDDGTVLIINKSKILWVSPNDE